MGSKADFERMREERIARNRQVMQELMGPSQRAAPKRRRTSTPRPKKPSPPSKPSTRYSLRSKAPLDTHPQPKLPDSSEDENVSEPEEVFKDSNVKKYSCGAPPSRRIQAAPFASDFTTLRPSAVRFLAGNLKDSYSIDQRDSDGLLMAAGKDGWISIWAPTQPADGENLIAPVLSARVHSGWIADAQFVQDPSNPAYTGTPVLTASNDGLIALWDMDTISTSSKGAKPKRLANYAPHSSTGIFSLHEKAGAILTASKDATVAITAIGSADNQFQTVRKYANLHDEVVKCAKWDPSQPGSNVFSSVGNSGIPVLADTRVRSDAPSLSLPPDGSPTPLHSVAWHPADGYTLATTGREPTIVVYDCRKPAILHRLTGHCGAQVNRCPRIYRADFVPSRNGACSLVTGGLRSKRITLYNISTGEPLSTGDVGFDCLNLKWSECTRSLLAARGRYLEQLFPEA